MTIRIRSIAALIAITLASAIVLADAPDADYESGAPISVVYPLQRLPLIFSHRAHLARGTTCAQCHADATTSRSAVDDLLPTEAACRACHAIDRADSTKAATPPAACTACHVDYSPTAAVQRVYLTPSPLVFSHAAHTAQACATCHDVAKVDLATTAQLPSMSSCLDCHAHADGATERHCTDCHLAKLGGLMETQFPFGDLVPRADGLGDSHGPGFATDHEQEARQVGATCNACHDKSECVACHQGVTKSADFHPGDYVMTHAIDARRGKPDCSACHRAESFCVACHERSGITTRASSQFEASTPGRNFHPQGWASPSSGSPNRHAGEARRNITSCASCHREEDCQTCHTAEAGMGNVSPHGSGWRGSARCRALDRDNRRMCLRCHISRSELGCDWGSSR